MREPVDFQLCQLMFEPNQIAGVFQSLSFSLGSAVCISVGQLSPAYRRLTRYRLSSLAVFFLYISRIWPGLKVFFSSLSKQRPEKRFEIWTGKDCISTTIVVNLGDCCTCPDTSFMIIHLLFLFVGWEVGLGFGIWRGWQGKKSKNSVEGSKIIIRSSATMLFLEVWWIAWSIPLLCWLYRETDDVEQMICAF